MITIYRRINGKVQEFPLEPGKDLPGDVIWVDMQITEETDHDRQSAIAAQLGVELPSQGEVWKNNVLNRLYLENGNAYMTAAIITKLESPYPSTSAVTFILTPNCLLTMRSISPTSFHIFSQRLQRPNCCFPTSERVLEGLLEEIITRVAHNSEVVVETLDKVSHDIFNNRGMGKKAKNQSRVMQKVLKTLGGAADLNSKINESLHSIQRMLWFFKQVAPMHKEDVCLDSDIDILITDTSALTQQSAFLSDKITFQLDATLGMINVEQNQIIKIFSVVAVFFMPPTLVSSLYGMNFKHMPELEWMYGYPFAIWLMLMCALIPYLYFRKKGWL